MNFSTAVQFSMHPNSSNVRLRTLPQRIYTYATTYAWNKMFLHDSGFFPRNTRVAEVSDTEMLTSCDVTRKLKR